MSATLQAAMQAAIDTAIASQPKSTDPYVERARVLVLDAIEASKGFPEDSRLASAQAHMLGALADLIRFQHGIGGKP